jgi:hypothetical protein
LGRFKATLLSLIALIFASVNMEPLERHARWAVKNPDDLCRTVPAIVAEPSVWKSSKSCSA